MAQNVEGYVEVFEASDGGTGDPRQTFWQFFVGGQPMGTKNPRIAETMKFAVETSSKVRVTFDGGVISQARLAFRYVCEKVRIELCEPQGEPRPFCEGRRLAPCEENPGD